MKVHYAIKSDGKNTRFEMTGEPDDADYFYVSNRKGKIGLNSAYFELPFCANENKIHPDLIAIVALLCFRPFTSIQIYMQGGVSKKFADCVLDNMKITIGPVDYNIIPRIFPENGFEGVAFSGGSDSVAALYLSPLKSKAFFLNRSSDNFISKSLYKNDAAIYSCDKVSQSGVDVIKVNSSLEFLREPVGFPVDWSNAAPALLCADYYSLRSVAFGLVLESAYFLGHSHYSDLRKRAIYSNWAPIFSTVSTPMSLPTAGLSEVITSKIATKIVPNWSAQSCVRGEIGKPCMNCFKCFRKHLLDFEISGLDVNDDHFDIPKKSKEVARRLLECPIHHENVLAYSMRNIKSNHSVALALKDKTNKILEKFNNLDVLLYFYSPADSLIPLHIRDVVVERINSVTRSMTVCEIDIVKSWDIDFLLSDSNYLTSNNKLRTLLE